MYVARLRGRFGGFLSFVTCSHLSAFSATKGAEAEARAMETSDWTFLPMSSECCGVDPLGWETLLGVIPRVAHCVMWLHAQ